MFRAFGKSKIAFVLAILFLISLFFFKGGSRYSNLFNSDNVVASVSGTPISTTKFNRTLQMNINNFGEMLGKSLTKKEIEAFQIHRLALGALINDAVFENEYDSKNFKIHETIIAKKTKERIPRLFDDNNKLNELVLNQFLQEQQLKIEDIVQIINFETRNDFFNNAFFKINYPNNFSDKIYTYDNHTRKIKNLIFPLEVVKIKKNITSNALNINEEILNFYNENIDKYMSKEKRDVNYLIVDTRDFNEKFKPSDYEISEYFNNNKELFLEKEKRDFIQFNFKNLEDAKNFKIQISNLNDSENIIKFANNNNIKFNSFEKINAEEILEEISNVLFKMQLNEQSEIIETALAKHVIILSKITKKYIPDLIEVKDKISDNLMQIEVANYVDDIKNDISNKILNGNSFNQINNELKLGKIFRINEITKNYNDYNKDQEQFFKSLIPNTFAANKNFLNDIVDLNQNIFYLYEVVDIKNTKPLELSGIHDIVFNDWQINEKKEIMIKEIEKNKDNLDYIEELSASYNLEISEHNINQFSQEQELTRDLIKNIFSSDKGLNVYSIAKDNVYIANIENILMPKNLINENNISLMSNLRGSFGEELLKKVKISTNENLIKAVIDRY